MPCNVCRLLDSKILLQSMSLGSDSRNAKTFGHKVHLTTSYPLIHHQQTNHNIQAFETYTVGLKTPGLGHHGKIKTHRNRQCQHNVMDNKIILQHPTDLFDLHSLARCPPSLGRISRRPLTIEVHRYRLSSLHRCLSLCLP